MRALILENGLKQDATMPNEDFAHLRRLENGQRRRSGEEYYIQLSGGPYGGTIIPVPTVDIVRTTLSFASRNGAETVWMAGDPNLIRITVLA